MSTKTTFKRIALVAVAALGFGMLSVVPSSATARTATSVVVGDIPSARVGVTAVVPVKVYLPAGSALNDTLTVNAEITAAPIMGGAANVASDLNAAGNNANDGGAYLCLTDVSTSCADIAGTSSDDNGRVGLTRSNGVGNYTSGGFAGVAASTTGSYAITAADVTAGYAAFSIRLTPDVAGTYTVLVSSNSGVVEVYTAGDPSATFSITTGGAPTGVTLRNLDASSLVTSMDKGIAVEVALVGGTLSGLETINLVAGGTISKGASAGAVTPDSTYAAAVVTAALVGRSETSPPTPVIVPAVSVTVM